MSTLTIFDNGTEHYFTFSGSILLSDALREAGITIAHPCGGRGVCKKCCVICEGDISDPSPEEIHAKSRLSCKTVLFGDSVVHIGQNPVMQQIEIGGAVSSPPTLTPSSGRYGAAVDIGTTTLALKLFDLHSGKELAAAASVNPQTSVAADVMGRIEAAIHGKGALLHNQVQSAVSGLLSHACNVSGTELSSVDNLVITGNTTMLYLLTQRDPEVLSHAPFIADFLFGSHEEFLGIPCYYPACMNAFVGADITSAVLSSKMTEQSATSLLCDLGTNGEIALWNDGKLYVTSTAAGPAFEGAGISCGCGSVAGAIDKVWGENGKIQVHTIGDAPALGLCGSGLIDAVAAFLDLGMIDETGAVGEESLSLSNEISLLPRDIRAVQLAKAAIAAGIETLLDVAGVSYDRISALYIAGGFGSHLNVRSASSIGLVSPELSDKVIAIGNAALSGASELLLDKQRIPFSDQIAMNSVHINLGGNADFNNNFIEQMMFPEP